jgi:mediator of RNA polymerase II transcription subunit 13
VYNRCPPSIPSADKTPLSTYSAPAFQLEECLPRNVPFKLISEPPQDLLRENSYMHLSYAISTDGTWITAAWTDNCGKSQAVVSYHLGTRGFGEVAKEIWSTTIEILQSRKVHWRVCIAKAGVMDREELETWVLLISCPTQFNLFITLLTVDTEPPLKLMPAIPGNSATGQPSANTPGSTPQAGVSPDPAHGLTPAATPSADNSTDPTADPDARLVDVTDETWGIILAHRLQNSNSTNQFSPALISGLLVKRGETPSTTTATTPHLTLGPIVIAVNILWIGAINSTRAATSPFPPGNDGMSPGGANIPPSPSPQERSTSSLMWTPTVQTRTTAENLLKEVLGQFRALGLLARLKGMRGTRHGSVPWHIAAAQRGAKGLGKVVGGL